jgi:hypothetical protein
MRERRANVRTMTMVKVADEVKGKVEDEVENEVEVVGDMEGKKNWR